VHPLDGAYVRLDLAEEHFAELRSVIEAFIDEEYELIRKVPNLDSYPEEKLFYFIQEQSPTIPPRIPALVGEIAYNLRASLDYLVYELAILDSGAEQENTQFPIYEAPTRFWGGRKRRLNGINDAHAVAIERLQPYNGAYWRHWLKLLQEISNEDKHMRLTIQGKQTGLWGEGTHDPAYLSTPDLDRGSEILIKRKVGDPERPVYMKFHYTLHVILEGGLPLIESLQEIKGKVADTLAQFKPEF